MSSTEHPRTDVSPHSAPNGSSFLRFFHSTEDLIAAGALVAMVLLPLAEITIRPFRAGGIPGSIPFVQHLTLWVGFLGATLAAREGKLIALATGTLMPKGRVRTVAAVLAAMFGGAVSAILARGAVDVVLVERDIGSEIALGVPVWIVLLVLPFSFLLIALRLMWHVGESWSQRILVALGMVTGLWLSNSYEFLDGSSAWHPAN